MDGGAELLGGATFVRPSMIYLNHRPESIVPGYTRCALLGLPLLPEPRCSLEMWLCTTAESLSYAAFVAS